MAAITVSGSTHASGTGDIAGVTILQYLVVGILAWTGLGGGVLVPQWATCQAVKLGSPIARIAGIMAFLADIRRRQYIVVAILAHTVVADQMPKHPNLIADNAHRQISALHTNIRAFGAGDRYSILVVPYGARA